jgi:hypothetical protein
MVRTALQILVLVASLSSGHACACRDDRVRYEPRSFLGYACEDDCERHKSGFAWAAERRLADASVCHGLDRAQSEGCRAWVEEGIDAGTAGFRWALENEIVASCLCDGAGPGFRIGCLRQLAPLTTPNRGRAAPKRLPARRTAGKLRR